MPIVATEEGFNIKTMKEVARNKNLSLKAKGLFFELYFHLNENIQLEFLKNEITGLTTLSSAMKELKQKGFVEIIREYKENEEGKKQIVFYYLLVNKGVGNETERTCK